MKQLIGLIFAAFITLSTSSYLQLPLIRTPQSLKSYNFLPIKCQNQSNLNQDADYKQACYEKDITYSIPFIKDGLHYSLSVDFTTPISWIKGSNCVVEGSISKCNRLTQTLVEKIKTKATARERSRLKKFLKTKEVQNAIIEGSSEIIRGEMQKSKNVSFIVKDSNRLNSFFELMMLGLFIYGQRDNVTLLNTNFVNAMVISPNLNRLSDGALSLRFDQTAETSFLQEIFTYVHAAQKTVTVYLGDNNTITIGDLTAKYTQFGYSGISWIPMPQDEGFGHMPQIIAIGFGDVIEDSEVDIIQNITAIFTLSASYISLPQSIITKNMIEAFKKWGICKINANSFVECSSSGKKKLQKIIQKNLIFKFQGANIIVPLKKLILNIDQGKRAIFNIKQSYNNRAVLGQPLFLQYFFAFDYLKNQVGVAAKRQDFDQFYFELVSLVRFLCVTLVLGCGFICCYEPCNSLARKCKKSKRDLLKKRNIKEKKRNSYQSIEGEGRSQQFQTKLEDILQNDTS